MSGSCSACVLLRSNHGHGAVDGNVAFSGVQSDVQANPSPPLQIDSAAAPPPSIIGFTISAASVVGVVCRKLRKFFSSFAK